MRGRTLLELVEEGAARVAAASPAMTSSAGALSYGALLRGARGIGGALAEAGIGRGARVGVWMDKTPAAAQALLGVLYAGAAYVPIDARSPWPRCRAVALDGQLAGVIADRGRLDALPQFLDGQSPRLVLVDGVEPAALAPQLPGVALESLAAARAHPGRNVTAPRPEDVAYILYTSGSTGAPKGVVHTHASGSAFVRWIGDTFGTGPEDVFASHAPFHFDLSICDLFAALASGATVHVLSSLEAMLPVYLVRLLATSGITVWYSVPSILVSMLEEGLERVPPARLRLVLFAGEVFPTPQLRRLRRALPRARLFNLFGPTETNVCTYYEVPADLPDDRTAPIPIGRGCEHMETFVLDDAGREVTAPGAEGTLWARDGNVMLGYWNDAERTARMLQPDPRGRPGVACCTGDRVRILPDGGYDFLGRRDHMVKTRGYRVDLGDVEATLVAHPAVLEAVVTPLPDAALGHRLVATVVLRAGQEADPEAIRAHCAGRLPGYMVPEAVAIRAELPRTSTGKADRGALRGEWTTGRDA